MRTITRRNFLKTAGAAVAAPCVITSAALGGDGKPPASERITGAAIGCGARGGRIRSAGGQLVAVCDPWRNRREGWAAGSKCRAYVDFRDVLARDDIDVVVIATPDHWHVPIAVAAAQAGKDIYCEKPLGMSIREDMAVRAAVKRYGRIFQFGTQMRSSSHCRHACELVRNGKLGRLREIIVAARYGASGGPTRPIPVPDDLDWPMWLGPAPWRPYTGIAASNSWWYAYDYSLGYMTTCGIHPMDQAIWAFDTHLAGPIEIEGEGTIGEGAFDALAKWEARISFPNGVRMIYKNADTHGWSDGADYTRFVGSEGMLHVTYGRGPMKAEPESLLTATLGPSDVRLAESNNHGGNFLSAVRTRAQPIAHIDDAFRADVLCHLADIAIRLGRKIRWDPVKEEIIGDDEAARMTTRALREPWGACMV